MDAHPLDERKQGQVTTLPQSVKLLQEPLQVLFLRPEVGQNRFDIKIRNSLTVPRNPQISLRQRPRTVTSTTHRAHSRTHLRGHMLTCSLCGERLLQKLISASNLLLLRIKEGPQLGSGSNPRVLNNLQNGLASHRRTGKGTLLKESPVRSSLKNLTVPNRRSLLWP